MKQIYYVYAYLDTRKPGHFIYQNYKFEYEPFYIGKGRANRLYKHLLLSDQSNPFKNRIINKIYKAGKTPIIIKLYEELSESEAHITESNLIKTIGRRDSRQGPLTNLTDGGEGMSGYLFTDEQRKRMGKSKKILFLGKNNPFYGKHHTSDVKKKMRNYKLGIPLSIEHKKKVLKTLTFGEIGKNNHMFNRHGKKHFSSKRYKIIDPCGTIHIIEGTIGYTIRKFCEKHNISYASLYKTYTNNKPCSRGITKGWKLENYEN